MAVFVRGFCCLITHYVYAYILLEMVSLLSGTPISGGEFVQTVDDITPKYPYVVSLQQREDNGTESVRYKHFCGGSLISKYWILTAAHCMWKTKIERTVAVIGQEDISSSLNLKRVVIEAVEYCRYQPYILRNDIALLRLQQPYEKAPPRTRDWGIPSNNKNDLFAKLPKCGIKINSKQPCKIIGFGATHYGGDMQSRLREAEVNIITNKKCEEIVGRVWAPQKGENTVCALGDKQDTCQGDSGGPLVCSHNGQEYVYGIVSHGTKCGLGSGIYTLTMPYLNWIHSIIDTNI